MSNKFINKLSDDVLELLISDLLDLHEKELTKEERYYKFLENLSKYNVKYTTFLDPSKATLKSKFQSPYKLFETLEEMIENLD